MLALIPLILQVAPWIVDHVFGEQGEEVTKQIGEVAKDVTGVTSSVEDAVAFLGANQDARQKFAMQLGQMKVDLDKQQKDLERAQLDAKIEELKSNQSDTVSARGQTVELAKAGSLIAWGTPLMSIVIFGTFLTAMFLVLHSNLDQATGQAAWGVMGILASAVMATVQYWMGGGTQAQQSLTALHQTGLDAIKALGTSSPAAIPVTPEPKPTPQQEPVSAQDSAPAPTQDKAAQATAADDGFTACMPHIYKWEGGYVNNPKDAGRATNMGITIRTLSKWRGKDCTIDDVKMLSREEADKIYWTDFWCAAQCGTMKPGVNLSVMDTVVLSGVPRGIKLVQKTLGFIAADVDGILGKKTKAALEKVDAKTFVQEFEKARDSFYEDLAKTNPNDETFVHGWENRAADTRQKALSMIN